MMAYCLASAQTLLPGSSKIEKEMQVKQIEQFMHRFNRKEVPPIVDSSMSNRDRAMLALLMDNKLIETRSTEVMAFIDAMIDRKVQLKFEDTSWLAIAVCKATYQKKENEIMLVLHTEHITGNMYKWVISDAYGDILSLRPPSRSKNDKITPTDNELFFMQLPDITTRNYENILNYSRYGYAPNQTSVFFALVASGQLKVDYVTNITYQFSVGGYLFSVDYFSREGLNSGWLISDFKTLEQ